MSIYNNKIYFLRAAILVLSLISLTMLNAQQQGMRPAVVEVATVQSQKLAPTMEIPGNVISKHYGWLSAETTGRITSISARGKSVKKGDIVAVIDTTTLRSQRREQESNIKAFEARISYLRNQVKRLDELRAQNIAALSQLEETQANLDAAISNKVAAEARLQQVKIAIAASSLRAQFDGSITEHQLQLGEHVTPGRQVIRIIDLENKEIVARTSIANISNLGINDSVSVNVNTATTQAILTSSVPYGDVTEGVYELRFALANSPVKIGQSIRLNIPQSQGTEALTVPRDAIILRSGGSSIYKVNDDNSTKRINVTTGVGNDNSLTITDASGELKAGDKVIIRGAERLRPGQPISIKD